MLDEKETPAVKMLQSIPGIGEDSAYIVGCDMSRFETADKLCSWAGVVPGNNESAGKRKQAGTTKGHALLKSTLVVCANLSIAHQEYVSKSSLHPSRASYWSEESYHGCSSQHDAGCRWILAAGALYADLGEEHDKKLDEERKAKALIRVLNRIGFDTETIEEQLEARTAAGS